MYIKNGLVQLTYADIKSKVGCSCLFGLSQLEKRLLNFCAAFLKANKEQIEDFGIYDLSPSVLLYGPPNTGKTTLCYTLFTTIKENITNEINFYNIDVGYMLAPELGKSSRNLEESFDYLKESCKEQKSWAFLVLDEMDAFCMTRSRTNEHDAVRRAMTTLMLELDKLHPESKIIIFGITNVPNLLDTAVLRRFAMQKEVNVDLSFEVFCKYLHYLSKPLNQTLSQESLREMFKIYKRRDFRTGDIKSVFRSIYIDSIASERQISLEESLTKSMQTSFSTGEHLLQQPL